MACSWRDIISVVDFQRIDKQEIKSARKSGLQFKLKKIFLGYLCVDGFALPH